MDTSIRYLLTLGKQQRLLTTYKRLHEVLVCTGKRNRTTQIHYTPLSSSIYGIITDIQKHEYHHKQGMKCEISLVLSERILKAR